LPDVTENCRFESGGGDDPENLSFTVPRAVNPSAIGG
jgi:hypothetical protein